MPNGWQDHLFIEIERRQRDEYRRENGWRLVISKSLLSEFGPHDSSMPSFSLNRYNQKADTSTPEEFSIVVSSINRNESSVLNIRRYSLISPEIHGSLVKIVFDETMWSLVKTIYFGGGSIMAIFSRPDQNIYIYRLVMCDAFIRKIKCVFDIRPPTKTRTSFISAFHQGSRLVVLFYCSAMRQNPNGQWDWLGEFHKISYEVPQNEDNWSEILMTSWESISIPIGMRNNKFSFSLGDQAIVTVLYGEGEQSLFVTFDGDVWRLDNFDTWKISIGSRLVEAYHSFNITEPEAPIPLDEFMRHVKRHRSHSSMETYDNINEDAICYRQEGIWYRPRQKIPSLKFMAATKLLELNPKLTPDQLKKEIGFDLFDEIPNGSGDLFLIDCESDFFERI